jgi:hypothetical protein
MLLLAVCLSVYVYVAVGCVPECICVCYCWLCPPSVYSVGRVPEWMCSLLLAVYLSVCICCCWLCMQVNEYVGFGFVHMLRRMLMLAVCQSE